jgi:hypothetical protein
MDRAAIERAARRHKALPKLLKPKVVGKVKERHPKRPKGKPRPKAKRTDTLFPTGQEFELTARYMKRDAKGQSAPSRNLNIKVRVTLTSAMTNADARALVDRAIRDGVPPPGVQVEWIDWSRGVGSKGTAGSDSTPSHKDLRNLFPLLGGGDQGIARFAPVASDRYDEDEEESEEW